VALGIEIRSALPPGLFKRAPAIDHVSLPDFEPDLLFAGVSRECKRVSASQSWYF